jgi:hypothetical protein
MKKSGVHDGSPGSEVQSRRPKFEPQNSKTVRPMSEFQVSSFEFRNPDT